MSEFDGKYVKTGPSPVLWLVEGGKRTEMRSMDEVYAHGLRQVVTVDEETLEGIPVAGQKKPRKTRSTKGTKGGK